MCILAWKYGSIAKICKWYSTGVKTLWKNHNTSFFCVSVTYILWSFGYFVADVDQSSVFGMADFNSFNVSTGTFNFRDDLKCGWNFLFGRKKTKPRSMIKFFPYRPRPLRKTRHLTCAAASPINSRLFCVCFISLARVWASRSNLALCSCANVHSDKDLVRYNPTRLKPALLCLKPWGVLGSC